MALMSPFRIRASAHFRGYTCLRIHNLWDLICMSLECSVFRVPLSQIAILCGSIFCVHMCVFGSISALRRWSVVTQSTTNWLFSDPYPPDRLLLLLLNQHRDTWWVNGPFLHTTTHTGYNFVIITKKQQTPQVLLIKKPIFLYLEKINSFLIEKSIGCLAARWIQMTSSVLGQERHGLS